MDARLNFDDQKTAQELLEAIRFFAAKGWCPATSTNHSARLTGGGFLISRSGVDKSVFTATDLVVIDQLGQLVHPAPEVKPSAETEIHTALYARFPHVHCVLHTHSRLGTWLSRAHVTERAIRFEGWEILKGLAGNGTHEMVETLPIVPNSQHMPDILAGLDSAWAARPHGFLIAGHGLYTWGASVAEAKRHVETWEFLFELHATGSATWPHSNP
jgi:methylthioribulose-1-phosphate dehydratase